MSIGVHRIYIPMSYARIDFSTLQFSLVRQTPFFCWITFVVVANMNENLVFECRNNDEYIGSGFPGQPISLQSCCWSLRMFALGKAEHLLLVYNNEYKYFDIKNSGQYWFSATASYG